jgi:hypothetical protein
MMPVNPFNESSEALRRAIKKDIVDPGTRIFSGAPLGMMAWFKTVKPRQKKPPFINPQQNPQALRPQAHTFGRTPSNLDPEEDFLIELSRVTVPEDSVGYLVNIEQYVASRFGEIYPTNSQYWGSPYNETVGGLNDLRWYLRLRQNEQVTDPNPFLLGNINIPNHQRALPGTPYIDLPVIDGLWYPASKQNAFRSIIPSGYTLSLIVWIPETSMSVYQWVCAGRLTAQVQTELCNEALVNTRTLFT